MLLLELLALVFSRRETMNILRDIAEIGQGMVGFLAVSVLLVILAIILYTVISAF